MGSMKKEVTTKTTKNATKTKTTQKAPRKIAMKTMKARKAKKLVEAETPVSEAKKLVEAETPVSEERWRPTLLTQCTSCNFIQEEVQLRTIAGESVFMFYNEDCLRCSGLLRIKKWQIV